MSLHFHGWLEMSEFGSVPCPLCGCSMDISPHTEVYFGTPEGTVEMQNLSYIYENGLVSNYIL